MNTNNATSTTPWALSRGVRRGLLALVLALAALLLALGAPVAQAAPPEVTASDNPVLIPEGETTGKTTLTWTLTAIPQLAHLTVTESGTPAPVLDLPVSQPLGTGQVQLPVTYGKTYTAQLKTPVFNQPLGAPLTITTKRPPERPDFNVDFGCMVQCINGPGVDAHGGWAQFDITTTETALMTLEASTTEPNPDGTWSNPAAVAAFSNSLVPVQNWKPQLLDLESSTTYYYVVRADDGKGKQVKTGSFKTLTRRVEVTFAEIEMIDDSDDFGDCECNFEFGAGNETKQYGTKTNPKSIASGTTVHPNVTFTINNAPSEIPIHAVGNDDDEWDTFYTPTKVSVYTPTKVSVSRPGIDEEFTESFTISGTTLDYKVRGTYKVTYVP
jgi:hypothetical protein